jgi:hypothetical protein
VYSRWAVRTQQSLESRKGDPLETGISATIHTPGLAVALYTTSQMDTDFKVCINRLWAVVLFQTVRGYSCFPLVRSSACMLS